MIIFQRGHKLGSQEPFDLSITKDETESNLVTLVNKGMKGDHCETVTAKDFIAHPFPVFLNENFMGEAWLWHHIAAGKKTIFINKVIYLCEYLADGLSKAGRSLRIKNPLAGMEHAKVFLSKGFKLSIRFKQAILYNSYGCFCGMDVRKAVMYSEAAALCAITYPLGWLLYQYWNKKYMKN